MPVNTVSAAVHITPTVIKTFYKHYKQKASKLATGAEGEQATDDVLYDEAFHIVKAFIELGTHNTVESLQAFTNTHIISPPWAAVSPVLIPFTVCNKAADVLVGWFDPEELKKVVGGERWWQIRGLDGIDAEWVAERKFLGDAVAESTGEKGKEKGQKLSENDLDILRMNRLDKVMLYVHGGAYFWGSINTHRYQIIKYARKIKGRAFAVNYRKAPQYPWPCALQDVLAAYLYLIDPPPSALHTPVSSSKIVIAGDSAGGGLCISLLTVLRDMGMPMPAGAVLISPWVDLTHSFSSVMDNTSTDIIPPHGFIHKPSTTWPVDARPRQKGRIAPTENNPPPEPGHADTLTPDQERVKADRRDGKVELGVSQADMLADGTGSRRGIEHPRTGERANSQEKGRSKRCSGSYRHSDDNVSSSGWEPKPPKVLMNDPNSTPLELRSQIQLYATNEQLTHPLVSPILQGSLCNLCPLYIIAGNDEALRDEIIYLAHRAGYPEEFPPKIGAVKESKRQAENVEKFKIPTKVHLQVFDGMCHVLTVFTFHPSAKYAYRSIAEFVKSVTDDAESQVECPAFPELKANNSSPSESSSIPTTAAPNLVKGSADRGTSTSRFGNGLKSLSAPISQGLSSLASSGRYSVNTYEQNKGATKEQIQENPSASRLDPQPSGKEGSMNKLDFSSVVMIRQRVNIYGIVRAMEPKEEIPCLRKSTDEIGLLREAPAQRWLDGQRKWDEMFKATAKRVEERRKKNEKKYEKLLVRAKELGLTHTSNTDSVATHSDDEQENAGDGDIQRDRRWGPLDLDGENPPPSAIAARRDTPEALALLTKTLYHTAPRTVKQTPKRKAVDLIKAAFDPADDPSAPPKQSVSEQQHSGDVIPLHGLNIWTALMTYFGKRTSTQATKGKHKAVSSLKRIKVGFTRTSTSRRLSRTINAASDSAQTPSTAGSSD